MHKYHNHFIASIAFIICFTAEILHIKNGECEELLSVQKEKSFLISINRKEETPLFKWVTFIYTEVFRRLNIKVQVVYHPLKRSSIELNEGRVDGEPARIYDYGATYPNLVRIEEPVFSMTVAAYKAVPSMPDLNGWESLKNTHYLVDYPKGMKVCETTLSIVVKAEQISTSTNTWHGIQKLALKRIDYYIDDLNSISPILRNKSDKLKDKVFFAGVMQKTLLYMYVHKKHKSLAPEIAEMIKKIKSEGLIEYYQKKAFGISDQ